MSEDREGFFARVKRALDRGRYDALVPPAEPAPEVDAALLRLASSDGDLTALFLARAAEVGTRVHRTSRAAAGPLLAGLLCEQGARSVLAEAGETGDRIGVEQAVRSAGCALVGPGCEPDALFGADAGITDVAAALAETGTLLLHSGPGRGRGASLIPPWHIALVRGSDLRPDLVDCLRGPRRDRPEELASSRVLVTGPSKTADIEGELVVGVHGPGRVDVLLVEDL